MSASIHPGPGGARRAVVASRNRGKLAELQALLAPLSWQLQPVSEFSGESPEETAPSFVENALIKARHAAQVSGLPAIADDSGLEVAVLSGAPGVRSARYAAGPGQAHADDAANNAKLLAALAGVPPAQRGARFVSVLVFLRTPDDPVPVIAEGYWPGRILETPRGAGGFGYDPLFWVDGEAASAAELDPTRKNAVSHRARAAARLLERLRGLP